MDARWKQPFQLKRFFTQPGLYLARFSSYVLNSVKIIRNIQSVQPEEIIIEERDHQERRKPAIEREEKKFSEKKISSPMTHL